MPGAFIEFTEAGDRKVLYARPALAQLLTVGGLTWLLGGLAESIAKSGLAGTTTPTTGTLVVAQVNDSSWVIGVLFSVGLPLLLFPDGRTRSRGS